MVEDVPELTIEGNKLEKEIAALREMEEPPLDKFVEIDVYNQSLESYDELQDKLSYVFNVKNVSKEEISVQFLIKAPRELESYYLSSTETSQPVMGIINPGQSIEHTQLDIVKSYDSLSEEETEFIKTNGIIYYMYFEINDEAYFYELKLDVYK
ncbi:hypothetical protein [Texcoconibacillus texcoconensis]|uniref:Uncharacterized protein n=1 Tax=Texcoconibacillus texcoconensis TaxID=1095777 RepID=A0A840QT51_9BACI|nr:hypothetical protein [Texcoconibacillus texcoconensis]MBB5174716.1 hypothetical protein [Texcoconibacillus texcoconensis]